MAWALRGSEYTLGILSPRATRTLTWGMAVLIPMFLVVSLVFLADPTREPAQPAGKWVFEGYETIIGSPLDYMIIWLLFGMTFLIGLLFFINRKFHYMALLIILSFMAAINFFVIMTVLRGGVIEFPSESFLAFVVVIFGFALIPTLVAFLLGGGLTYSMAYIFRRPSLRKDSYATEWGKNFRQMAGFRIWRPRIFWFSLYTAIILFVGMYLFPVTEGSTYALISIVFTAMLFWIFALVLVQIVFNFSQGTIQPTRFTRQRKAPKSKKQSIQNIRKSRK